MLDHPFVISSCTILWFRQAPITHHVPQFRLSNIPSSTTQPREPVSLSHGETRGGEQPLGHAPSRDRPLQIIEVEVLRRRFHHQAGSILA